MMHSLYSFQSAKRPTNKDSLHLVTPRKMGNKMGLREGNLSLVTIFVVSRGEKMLQTRIKHAKDSCTASIDDPLQAAFLTNM